MADSRAFWRRFGCANGCSTGAGCVGAVTVIAADTTVAALGAVVAAVEAAVEAAGVAVVIEPRRL